MNQESLIYLTNIIIVMTLACLLTKNWIGQGRMQAMMYWMVAAWVLAVADILFAARPVMPHWLGRILPTLLVTVGHGGLLLGARSTGGLKLYFKPLVATALFHLGVLVLCSIRTEFAELRTVTNGVIWTLMSVFSFWFLRKAAEPFWKPFFSPANTFLIHGLFHALRVSLSAYFLSHGWSDAYAWTQMLGDLEVSFFMVALFVGILTANLQSQNDEVVRALAEVKTLSELLPICAWCKKVRDDDGYWKSVEDYFEKHSRVSFSHGICNDCMKQQMPEKPVRK